MFYDALVLEPDLDSIVERMGRFEVLLTAVLMGPLVPNADALVSHDVSQSFIVKDAGMIVSVSSLRDSGTLLRIAGVSVEQVGRALREYLKFLSPILGDDPWSRKW